MDLHRVSVFVRVAETGSFSRAAGRLGIAQSALSRQVRELERELGDRLFYRNGRGVVLTELGAAFLPRAQTLLKSASELLSDMKAMRGRLAGSITIGVPPSVSRLISLPVLGALSEDYPDIQLNIIEGFTGHISEWLWSGRIDLGVLYSSLSSSLSTDPLVSEDMFVIGPKNDPIGRAPSLSFSRLATLPLVLPTRPHGLRLAVDSACALSGVELDIRMQVDSLEAIVNLVTRGGLYTILPMTSVLEELRALRLAKSRICQPTISRELQLARSPLRPETRSRQAVAATLRSQVARLVKSGAWPSEVAAANA